MITTTRRLVRLTERVALAPDRVVGNCIPGVRLVSLASDSGRRFTRGALVEAAGRLNGVRVNINAPAGGQPRAYKDRIGWIESVRADDRGLVGDLRFNPHHACAAQLEWDARNGIRGLTAVLNADVELGPEGAVTHIRHVHSLDLIDAPMNSNLFEGDLRMSTAAPSAASTLTPFNDFTPAAAVEKLVKLVGRDNAELTRRLKLVNQAGKLLEDALAGLDLSADATAQPSETKPVEEGYRALSGWLSRPVAASPTAPSSQPCDRWRD